jgi:hypothetical protein
MMGGFVKPERERKHSRQTFAGVSRAIYWNGNIPKEDITAQFSIAFVQLRLPHADECWQFLIDYLHRFRRGVSIDAAADAASRMVLHWSFPEDHRAFRVYVKKCLDVVLRERKAHSMGTPADWAAEEEINRMMANPASDFQTFEKPLTLGLGNRHVAIQSGTLSTKSDWVSISRAAHELGVSRNYIYRLLRQSVVVATKKGGRSVLAPSEFERLSKRLNENLLKRAERLKLQQRGLSKEAARKRVYRARIRRNAVIEKQA